MWPNPQETADLILYLLKKFLMETLIFVEWIILNANYVNKIFKEKLHAFL